MTVQDTGDISNMDPKEVDQSKSMLNEAVKPEEHGVTGPEGDPATPANQAKPVEEPKNEEPKKEEPKKEEVEEEEYELELAEDSPISEEDFNAFVDMAQELGLSKDAATKLLKAKEDMYKKGMTASESKYAQEVKQLREDFMKDPVLSKNLEENIKVIALPVQKFGDDAFKELLRSDIGNHPALARFLLNVGNAMKSDTFEGKTVQAPPKEEPNILKSMYPAFFEE